MTLKNRKKKIPILAIVGNSDTPTVYHTVAKAGGPQLDWRLKLKRRRNYANRHPAGNVVTKEETRE